jgi:enoyl-CoA hydratase/carnithine racemase
MSVVRYENAGPVAWLTIDRPEARNALSAAVREGLFAGLRRFNEDAAARVLVLTGAGDKAFCAGADLKEMAQSAAVNGAAYAGGFLLAQSCDLCLAAEHATFAISEVKVGRGAPWAAPLPWLIPPRVAMQLLLTGDPITARRAHEIGLVNEVVPAAELRAAAQAMAERIAANAPLSVLAGKRTAGLIAEHPLSRAFLAADEIWEPVYLSEDAQEGPAAFGEKRPPVWRGR